MSGEVFKNFITIESALTRYIIGVGIIILIVIALKYISRTLQWLTEKFLNKRQIIGRGWISLIIKHKVLDHLFFAIGLCFLVGVNDVFLSSAYPKFTTFILRILNIIIIAKFTLLVTQSTKIVNLLNASYPS